MNAGVWLSARMTRASSSDTSGLPPECCLQSVQHVFHAWYELNVTNRYDHGDITTHNHVCDASVDMDPHCLALVDEDLLEQEPF